MFTIIFLISIFQMRPAPVLIQFWTALRRGSITQSVPSIDQVSEDRWQRPWGFECCFCTELPLSVQTASFVRASALKQGEDSSSLPLDSIQIIQAPRLCYEAATVVLGACCNLHGARWGGWIERPRNSLEMAGCPSLGSPLSWL